MTSVSTSKCNEIERPWSSAEIILIKNVFADNCDINRLFVDNESDRAGDKSFSRLISYELNSLMMR